MTVENEKIQEPEVWFYSHKGSRLGPVSAERIKNLHETGALEDNASVWKKGMSDWLPIRNTDLLSLSDLPPPLSSGSVNQTLVWVLAFVPLALSLIDIMAVDFYMRKFDVQSAVRIVNMGLIPWPVAALMNSVLAYFDERNLKKAGYSTDNMVWLAVLIVPVYLFVRAYRLKTVSWYGITWIAGLVLGLVLENSAYNSY